MGEEDKEKVRDLASQAKTAANDGNLQESMALFQQAYALYPSEKIKKRMEKLQEFINSQESEEEEDDMVDIGENFLLHRTIADNLYDYQKKGVLWFWELYKQNSGGILGDDMGLGKTIQVIAFISGMFDAENIKTVIIVAPLAVLVNWEKEFKKWAPGIRLKSFHGNKKQREENLKKIQKSRGVLLTTYGMVVSNAELLSGDHHDETFIWDYIILDEGHKIKNPNKTSRTIRNIPAYYHYICTGTAVQNNLMEMWSLFDFTHKGELLGMRKTFEIEFQKPIVRAREKDANAYSQQVGNQISERLRMIIAPYFLRRTKADIFCKMNDIAVTQSIDANGNEVSLKEENSKANHCTPRLDCVKHDLIIWVFLNDLQLRLYNGIIQSEKIKETLLTKRSPLTELNCLKKICDHPRLQTTLAKFLSSAENRAARLDCGIDDADDDGNYAEPLIDEAVHAPPVEELIEDSGKMVFLVSLMEDLKKGCHRVLIFSQSRKMLDIIQKVLTSMEHKVLRIDGSINNPQDREKIINKFQTDHAYNVMLMTTQIGSVGLNLTTADRLVIFDPSWNPGTDSQAVDRIYRLGQTKDVIIYRLITCGTIEEKIYRKQIFKNAIMKQTTGSSDNPYRYFTNQQLRELFVLDDPKCSVTQMQLEEMHTIKPKKVYFDTHLKFLNNQSSLFGVTHHDQLFTQEATDEDLVGLEDEVDRQVQLATQRVTEECNTVTMTTPKKKIRNKSESDQSLNPSQMNQLDNISILAQKNSSPMAGEQDLITELNATLANVKLNDAPEGNSSVESVSILDQSEEKQKVVDVNGEEKEDVIEDPGVIEEPDVVVVDGEEEADVVVVGGEEADVVEADQENIHSVHSTSDKHGSGSSVGDLYVSCLVESDERRIDMARISSTFQDIKIQDSPGNSVNNSEGGSMLLVGDTDSEDETDEGSFVSDCYEGKSQTHNEIILESFNNASYQNTKTKLTPQLLRDLGKGYRTPPFSPLGPTREDSIRRAQNTNRDASTPMDSTHISRLFDRSSQVSNSSDTSHNMRKHHHDSDAHQTESKSFIDVQDVGCSPITSTTCKEEAPNCLKDEDENKCPYPLSESKSFIDVQDVACSPIAVKVSLNNDSFKKSDSFSEEIEDTVPLGHDIQSCTDTIEDTVPVFPRSISKKHEGTHRNGSEDSPLEPVNVLFNTDSQGSESNGLDFGRLERFRESSLLDGKSTAALDVKDVAINANICNSDTKRIGPCDSELYKTLGYCGFQSKNSSPVVKKQLCNSPADQIDSLDENTDLPRLYSPHVPTEDVPVSTCSRTESANSSFVLANSADLQMKVSDSSAVTLNVSMNMSSVNAQTEVNTPNRVDSSGSHIVSPQLHDSSNLNVLLDSSNKNIINKDGVENTADEVQDVRNTDVGQLEQLVLLLSQNMNNVSVDDHTLMRISDLFEVLNIGGCRS